MAARLPWLPATELRVLVVMRLARIDRVGPRVEVRIKAPARAIVSPTRATEFAATTATGPLTSTSEATSAFIAPPLIGRLALRKSWGDS